MSRYDTKVEVYGETFDVLYGHDHATGTTHLLMILSLTSTSCSASQ